MRIKTMKLTTKIKQIATHEFKEFLTIIHHCIYPERNTYYKEDLRQFYISDVLTLRQAYINPSYEKMRQYSRCYATYCRIHNYITFETGFKGLMCSFGIKSYNSYKFTARATYQFYFNKVAYVCIIDFTNDNAYVNIYPNI